MKNKGLHLMATETPEAGLVPLIGFSQEEVAAADKMETWGTDFENDRKYMDYRLLKDGEVIFSKKFNGC